MDYLRNPEVQKGIQAVQAQRARDGLSVSRGPVRASEVAQNWSIKQPDSRPESVPVESCHPEAVKLWPEVGLAAITGNRGGAWRAWTLSKALDSTGAGKVNHADLVAFLDALGVAKRTRQRWLNQARRFRLLIPARDGEVYYLASLARAAAVVRCGRIGYPVKISAVNLVSKGWRAFVWSGYLATLPSVKKDKKHGRISVVSQKRKAELTGIHERTQRNYQAAVDGEKIANYAYVRKPKDYVTGLRDMHPGRCYFVNRYDQLVQKLPDTRIVPAEVARRAKRGRSQKAQRALKESSSIVGRGNQSSVRLFNKDHKQARANMRKASRLDDSPDEIFQLAKVGKRGNTWDILPAF